MPGFMQGRAENYSFTSFTVEFFSLVLENIY